MSICILYTVHSFRTKVYLISSSLKRMDEFRYTLSRQLHKQSPMVLLGPEEVAEMVPFMNMDNIQGGLFTPSEVLPSII